MARAYRLKNDRFRKQRGGRARLLLICCGKCGDALFLYQKDGVGRLKRCYLDRIVAVPAPDGTPACRESRVPVGLEPVKCGHCGMLVGTPMVHWSGRPALRLRLSSFSKKELSTPNRHGRE